MVGPYACLLVKIFKMTPAILLIDVSLKCWWLLPLEGSIDTKSSFKQKRTVCCKLCKKIVKCCKNTSNQSVRERSWHMNVW